MHFKSSDIYETSDAREINCILRASQVVEVTDEAGQPAAKATAQNTGDAQKEDDMTKWGREKLEKKAMELGYSEQEVADAKNKAELQGMIEKKMVEADATAKFEENKKVLAERGVDVTAEMTPEEVAQLVLDTQGA